MSKTPKKADQNKKNKSSSGERDRFRGRNLSPLDRHPREGKTLKNPFSAISPSMTPRSWVNECIPNVLWACILAATLEREHYLRLFRSVAINIRENLENHSELFITHNFISKFSDREFDIAFRNVLNDEQAASALSAMLLVNCLPDAPLSASRLSAPTDDHWQILAEAVASCFDHQSQKATDIRWIKLMFFIITGKVQFPRTMADRVEDLRLYPERGDMRAVRPMIRATELSFRMIEFGEEGKADLPPPHQMTFWDEVYRKTGCLPQRPTTKPQTADKLHTRELMLASNLVADHFHATIEHTAIDARHDSSFGLVLNALNLLIESAASYSHSSPIGRSTLRSIVECFITLSFLIAKDDPELWLKHRDHGNGQTKLAFLKNLAAKNVPKFVDLDHLESLANEDRWMEFSDINLGAWSAQNLRTMAIDANLKDIYDTYYDLCSGYTHGHWSAIRDSSFSICFNPLHRFHKIPSRINFGMRSILNDGVTLINRMLDELDKIYPGMTHRIPTESNKKKSKTPMPKTDKEEKQKRASKSKPDRPSKPG